MTVKRKGYRRLSVIVLFYDKNRHLRVESRKHLLGLLDHVSSHNNLRYRHRLSGSSYDRVSL